MALTEKQKRFCDEYLIDLNATQAAIRAGYSKRSARQIAERNMTKDDIQKYIKERMDEKEDELIADQDEVLRYLTATMRREKKECIVVTIKEKKSVYVPDKKNKQSKRKYLKLLKYLQNYQTQIKQQNFLASDMHFLLIKLKQMLTWILILQLTMARMILDEHKSTGKSLF